MLGLKQLLDFSQLFLFLKKQQIWKKKMTISWRWHCWPERQTGTECQLQQLLADCNHRESALYRPSHLALRNANTTHCETVSPSVQWKAREASKPYSTIHHRVYYLLLRATSTTTSNQWFETLIINLNKHGRDHSWLIPLLHLLSLSLSYFWCPYHAGIQPVDFVFTFWTKYEDGWPLFQATTLFFTTEHCKLSSPFCALFKTIAHKSTLHCFSWFGVFFSVFNRVSSQSNLITDTHQCFTFHSHQCYHLLVFFSPLFVFLFSC